MIGADSLAFLTKESLFEVSKRLQLCVACFTGKYPTELYSSIEDANKDHKF
jgi:amidophosphoribosyltransferase